jgi:RNA polymerase sigma factor (sigma-70 family)
MRDVRTATPADAIEALLRTGEPLDDRDALEIHGHYFARLCGYAKKSGGVDPEGAANLALFDTFRAHGRNPIEDEAAFRSYLFRATKSHVLNEARRQIPTPAILDDDLLESADRSDGHCGDDVVERQWFSGVFEQLPEDHQAVLNLRVVEGWSAEEVGDRLGRGPNAVYQLQHRAQSRLRQLVLVALLVLAIVAGAAALWQLGAPSSQVINPGPVDQPTDTSLPTTEPTPDQDQSLERLAPVGVEVPSADDPQDLDRATTSVTTPGLFEPTATVPAPVDRSSSNQSATDQAEADGQLLDPKTPSEPEGLDARDETDGSDRADDNRSTDGAAGSKPLAPVTTAALGAADDEPGEPTAFTTVAAPAAETTSTVGAGPKQIITTTVEPVGPPFNVCYGVVHDGMLHLKLYDPVQAAPDATFDAPEAIKLTIVGDDGSEETVVVNAQAQDTNLGWIVAGGDMSVNKPDVRTIWGAEIGPAGTVFTRLQYRSKATGFQWRTATGCPR